MQGKIVLNTGQGQTLWLPSPLIQAAVTAIIFQKRHANNPEKSLNCEVSCFKHQQIKSVLFWVI